MVKKQQAQKFLLNAPPDKFFWVHDGRVLKNLEELEGQLLTMPNEIFLYHVNKDKNDFAKWISDVLGDKAFALDLKKAKTAHAALKKVKEHVHSLKKAAG
ncbi:MAG TPA: hypothetical protein VI564_00140 [Candidatus Nanoarchaeia archaeon]|nr:hypothetical protein [Candidatus Nanoarchaeia archaeon]